MPSAPGGPTDIPARLLSQILPKLGQPAIVENRPGAGGAIGARAVATAAPDGHTLLVGNTSVLAVIPAVSASAGYDPAKSFAPVAKISESYQILVVHPVGAVEEREANSSPTRRPIRASSTSRTPARAACRISPPNCSRRAPASISSACRTRAAAKPSPPLLGSQVHCTFEAISILLPLIRDGKVRALGDHQPHAHAARDRTSRP